MKKAKICAMIAAAGNSTRMRYPKALVPIFGQPAVAHSAQIISTIKPSELFATLPPSLLANEDLKAHLALYNCQVSLNRFPHQGYAGSIRTILEQIKNSSDGLFIMPVDSPIFCSELVNCMNTLAGILIEEPIILVPRFFHGAGHPVYVSKHLYEQLAHCNDIGGLRGFILAHQKKARAVFWPDARVLLNINSPSDLFTLRN